MSNERRKAEKFQRELQKFNRAKENLRISEAKGAQLKDKQISDIFELSPQTKEIYLEFLRSLNLDSTSMTIRSSDFVDLHLLLYHLQQASSLIYRQDFGGEENTVQCFQKKIEATRILSDIGLTLTPESPVDKI